jgi:hypothetical protein
MIFNVMNPKSIARDIGLVGLTGFGPVTFARNRVFGAVSTGFSFDRSRISSFRAAVSKPIVLLSGARRHPELDYSPTTTYKKQQTTNKNLITTKSKFPNPKLGVISWWLLVLKLSLS